MKTNTRIAVVLFFFLFFVSYISPLIFNLTTAQGDTEWQPPTTFFDSRVQYASQWCDVTPVKWFNSADNQEYEITAGQYINTVPDAPPARVITSNMRKVGEEYLGVYPSGDGRDIIMKEYTLAFDAVVYTRAFFSDYYGDVTPITQTDELYRMEYWVYHWGCIGEENCDSWSWQEVEENRQSGWITFHGYDLTLDRFEDVYAEKYLDGNVIFQLTLNTQIWKDVFGDQGPLHLEAGEWVYTGDVYSAIRQVNVKSTTSGMLEETTRPTLIVDSAKSLDGKYDGEPDLDQMGSQRPINAGFFSVFGYYKPEDSVLELYERPYDAEGEAPGTSIVTYYGPEAEQVVFWSNRGYDPDGVPVDTVFILPIYSLKPQQNLYQYTYKYHWESLQVEDRLGDNWKLHSGLQSSEKSVIMTVGWELWNYYVYNTFEVKIVIGSYYDWEPFEPTDEPILTPPTRQQGNLTFPVVTSGDTSGGVILPILKEPSTFLIAFFATFGIYIAIKFVMHKRSTGSWNPGAGTAVKWIIYGLLIGAIVAGIIWFITFLAGVFGWLF